MKTQIAPVRTSTQRADAIEAAVYLLTGGYPVALPTETVYGLAAWALNPEAVLRIFQVKERPKFDPLIVHLPNQDWLNNLCVIHDEDLDLVQSLIARFWPGPLTLVLPRNKIVPDLVTAGLPTVAVRMSAEPVFKEVIEGFGQPLAAPSANRFGRISPTTAAHVYEELNERIHLIVDDGPCEYGVESTIVMPSKGKLWILRDGPVTRAQLSEFGEVETQPRKKLPHGPGQLKSHYAPRAQLTLLKHDETPLPAGKGPVGLLAWCSPPQAKGFAHVEILSRTGNYQEAASTLFAKLRILDSMGMNRIIAESVSEEGLGIAIMDRLRKASGNG
jgi:L-threonylcarbamoyladenylate synthase